MTDDKMPPLPRRDHAFFDPFGDGPDIEVWRDTSMHAYARQYAAARAAPLVEALGTLRVELGPFYLSAPLSVGPLLSRIDAALASFKETMK